MDCDALADYANPVAYFVKSLCINEMTSPDWGTLVEGNTTLGELALANRWGVQSNHATTLSAARFGWLISRMRKASLCYHVWLCCHVMCWSAVSVVCFASGWEPQAFTAACQIALP